MEWGLTVRRPFGNAIQVAQDKIKVIDSAGCYFLKTQANFTKWEEKVISVSDDALVLENETKIKYYYKKFVPYDKRK